MKKIMGLLLVAILVLSLAACGNTNNESENNKEASGDVQSTDNGASDDTATDASGVEDTEATVDTDSGSAEDDLEDVLNEDADNDSQEDEDSSEDDSQAGEDATDDEAHDHDDVIYDAFEEAVVATVNDSDIMLSEVNFMLFQIKNYYEQQVGTSVWDEPGTDGLNFEEETLEEIKNYFIQMKVVSQLAEERGITLPDEDLEYASTQAVAIASSIPENIQAAIGVNVEVIEQVMIMDSMSKQFFIETRDDYVYDEAEYELLLQSDNYYQSIIAAGPENYAGEVRARHILISNQDDMGNTLEGEALEEKIALIEELRQRALDGEDFAELAVEYTDDPGSVATGGEYTFGRGRMVKPFEDTAFSLEVGEISEVIETDYGYHIIKLEEIIPPTQDEIDGLYEYLANIEDQAKQYLQEPIYLNFINDLIATYEVVVNDAVWSEVSLREPMY
jgi:foldase protein PrsA